MDGAPQAARRTNAEARGRAGRIMASRRIVAAGVSSIPRSRTPHPNPLALTPAGRFPPRATPPRHPSGLVATHPSRAFEDPATVDRPGLGGIAMPPEASSDPLPHPVGFTVAGCTARGSHPLRTPWRPSTAGLRLHCSRSGDCCGGGATPHGVLAGRETRGAPTP